MARRPRCIEDDQEKSEVRRVRFTDTRARNSLCPCREGLPRQFTMATRSTVHDRGWKGSSLRHAADSGSKHRAHGSVSPTKRCSTSLRYVNLRRQSVQPCPRGIANAPRPSQSSGLGDVPISAGAEFFIFDGVTWSVDMSGAG